MLSSISYYFHDADRGGSLPASLLRLVAMADVPESATPTDRYSAAALRGAIDAFAEVVGTRYLGLKETSTATILLAYAADHQLDAKRPEPTR